MGFNLSVTFSIQSSTVIYLIVFYVIGLLIFSYSIIVVNEYANSMLKRHNY